jgi:hypothetical protein
MAAMATGASAAVINGPTLNTNGGGWTTTGLGFTALTNSTLTGFVYQNQGAADTVVLTDAAGNVLDSVNTPSGTPSDPVSVSWALSAGSTYWLLQTTISNELFASYGGALPSDTDISIVQSGTFAYNISDAVNNVNGWGANQYWAAFNDITTSSGAIPEPTTWAFTIMGMFGLGAVLRRRAAVAA